MKITGTFNDKTIGLLKYILATLIVLGCVSGVIAQDTITLQQVKSRIGDSITVCGRVDDTRYLVTADTPLPS